MLYVDKAVSVICFVDDETCQVQQRVAAHSLAMTWCPWASTALTCTTVMQIWGVSSCESLGGRTTSAAPQQVLLDFPHMLTAGLKNLSSTASQNFGLT